jgi:hypothetical protein
MLRIKVKDGEEMAPKILERLIKSSLKVLKMSITEPTMDEVYMEYTGRKMRNEESDSREAFAMRRTLRRARG